MVADLDSSAVRISGSLDLDSGDVHLSTVLGSESVPRDVLEDVREWFTSSTSWRPSCS